MGGGPQSECLALLHGKLYILQLELLSLDCLWCPNCLGLSDPLLITFNLLQMCRSVFYLSTYLHLINFLKTLVRPQCILLDNRVKTRRMSVW